MKKSHTNHRVYVYNCMKTVTNGLPPSTIQNLFVNHSKLMIYQLICCSTKCCPLFFRSNQLTLPEARQENNRNRLYETISSEEELFGSYSTVVLDFIEPANYFFGRFLFFFSCIKSQHKTIDQISTVFNLFAVNLDRYIWSVQTIFANDAK